MKGKTTSSLKNFDFYASGISYELRLYALLLSMLSFEWHKFSNYLHFGFSETYPNISKDNSLNISDNSTYKASEEGKHFELISVLSFMFCLYK